MDIESTLLEKGKDLSVKTAIHVRRLFERFGYDEVFGRSAVMNVVDLKQSGASKLLSNLVQKDIIEPVWLRPMDAMMNVPVSGYGKGKYKFKK